MKRAGNHREQGNTSRQHLNKSWLLYAFKASVLVCCVHVCVHVSIHLCGFHFHNTLHSVINHSIPCHIQSVAL